MRSCAQVWIAAASRGIFVCDCALLQRVVWLGDEVCAVCECESPNGCSSSSGGECVSARHMKCNAVSAVRQKTRVCRGCLRALAAWQCDAKQRSAQWGPFDSERKTRSAAAGWSGATASSAVVSLFLWCSVRRAEQQRRNSTRTPLSQNKWREEYPPLKLRKRSALCACCS